MKRIMLFAVLALVGCGEVTAAPDDGRVTLGNDGGAEGGAAGGTSGSSGGTQGGGGAVGGTGGGMMGAGAPGRGGGPGGGTGNTVGTGGSGGAAGGPGGAGWQPDGAVPCGPGQLVTDCCNPPAPVPPANCGTTPLVCRGGYCVGA